MVPNNRLSTALISLKPNIADMERHLKKSSLGFIASNLMRYLKLKNFLNSRSKIANYNRMDC